MNEYRYGRKRKGIKKELNQVLSDWQASITDPIVAKLVKHDTIVTGGSIANMLLGESVNDYDIYFKTLETTKAVAEYYLKPYLKTNEVEINEQGDRIKVFIRSNGALDLPKPDGPFQLVYASMNALTLSDKLQIVLRFHGSPEEVHKSFDFVHATCWYDWKEDFLEFPTATLESLLSRTLVYTGSLYPIASLFRMKKFLLRGWRISAGEILKIAWQISELNLKDMSELTEQLTGVDMMYMAMLVKALETVDTEKLNASYVVFVIDRIFNDADNTEPYGDSDNE